MKKIISIIFALIYLSCSNHSIRSIKIDNRPIQKIEINSFDFTDGDQGWKTENEDKNPTWKQDESSGNAYITSSTSRRYFKTPDSFVGDHRDMYCKNIYYSIKLPYGSGGGIPHQSIMLHSKDKKLMVYSDRDRIVPNDDEWTEYEVPFDTLSNKWLLYDEPIDKEDLLRSRKKRWRRPGRYEFLSVLQNLDSIYIPTRYTGKGKETALDNVYFGEREGGENFCKPFSKEEDKPFPGKVERILETVFEGNGVIDDYSGTGTLQILPKDLHTILVIPEGYTEKEINSGIFYVDIRNWIEQSEWVEPFRSYKNAFRILQYNAPSDAYITENDREKTLLGILPAQENTLDNDMTIPSKRVWKIVEDNGLLTDDTYPRKGITSNVVKNLTIVILVYDPKENRSGFSGFVKRFPHPDGSNKNLSVAISRNTTHEFLHSFSHLSDEYLDKMREKKFHPNQDAESSNYLSNLSPNQQASLTPWKHLLRGGKYNPDIANFIGTFGDAKNGYHSEAKCIMNGRHHNKDTYGGDGQLRDHKHICNWCREITVFRLYEKVGIFKNPNNDFMTWKEKYRDNYYRRKGLSKPEEIPARNSEGKAIYPLSQ